jgi:hypothetical protein
MIVIDCSSPVPRATRALDGFRNRRRHKSMTPSGDLSILNAGDFRPASIVGLTRFHNTLLGPRKLGADNGSNVDDVGVRS